MLQETKLGPKDCGVKQQLPKQQEHEGCFSHPGPLPNRQSRGILLANEFGNRHLKKKVTRTKYLLPHFLAFKVSTLILSKKKKN